MKPPKKRCELEEVLRLLVLGKTKKEVRKRTGLNPTALSNHLRRLEELDNIRRVGKYKIDILSSSLNHPRVTKNKVHIGFNKRGHAHNVTAHFHKKINLKELSKVRQEAEAGILEKLKFGSLKLIRNGFTIWINSHNLTIYSNNSYYSNDSLKSKFKALREVDNLIQNLIYKYGFPKSYGIEVFREHYGLIFNKFANWLLKKGRKMYVQDKKGKSILWVDDSRKDDIGLKEFEGEDPIIINNADTFFSSHEKHNFKVDADFTLKAISGLTNAQLQTGKQLTETNRQLLKYEEQNKAHLEVIQEYRKESISNQKESRENRKLIKELLNKIKT